MKSCTAIFLSVFILLGSLLPKGDALQLVKVGELLKHYQMHKALEKEDLSFLAFLSMHYSATSKHTKTAKHSHSHLPSLDSQAVHAFVLPAFHQIALVFKPIVKDFTDAHFVWKNLYRFSMTSTLLNPPRLG